MESTIITKIQPAQVAVDGSSLFYADGDQSTEIHQINMTDGMDTIIERSL
ncbi:hypothetical protein [Paenibacillus sp. LHD-38]|nr:hypothetical protein [Paenibacillus sp. LHD-38]MDQ8737928.1 hypothetical protein [Paenibacillus sp. LHD-38]